MEKIQTNLKYPVYNEQEAIIVQPATENIQGRKEFHVDMFTTVRKQHDGVWYLIPVRVNYTQKLTPGPNEEQQKAQIRREVEVRFHAECYKALLFYIISNTLAMSTLDGRPLIYEDADQRSEEERLIPRQ
jgi:hypothetical protein